MIARRLRLDVLALAVLAYVPALSASPGKLAADTKLYLYLDPGGLLSGSVWAYDAGQYGGWVPHQNIGYLWPMGPWFGFFDLIGVAPWIAHRLWIGTLFVLAGLGVRYAARTLGIGATGALVAAVVYQLSPYVLPYVSRTSVLLLAWAALGWLVGLTVMSVERGGWRHPAAFALVAATAGATNLTALALLAPAPLVWLLDRALARHITWRAAASHALRLGGLTVAASAWWLAALAVQARDGADVLAFSESLEATAFTSTGAEVLRGLGYWLFYVRDPVVATTSASRVYLQAPGVIAVGFALVCIGLVGIVAVRSVARRYLGLLLLCGVVLSVGPYPIEDPSPLMAPFADASRSPFVLAFRSYTRAVPLVVLALALGAGTAVGALRGRCRRLAVPAAVVVVLAAVNLPALWSGEYVDPALAHEGPPGWWDEVAAELDRSGSDARVLQLPGVESAIHEWGYTVEPVLPGLSDRPLLTRDWLPLGSPVLMDTLYALDDRFQAGTVEPDSIAPVARFLGADTVLVVLETAFERFRTPRPEPTWALYLAEPAGLGTPTAFGPFAERVPTLAMLDEWALVSELVGTPTPPLALVPVADPADATRVGEEVVLLVGDGDGLVDAAGAGLLTGHEILRYAAALDDDELLAAAEDARLVVLTDTNRVRARQWRGSQDVWGFTEDGVHPPLLEDDPADNRLDPFGTDRPGDRTVTELRGSVRATASSYGEPFSYRPEARAALAVDGDLTTAWWVADRAEPVGERLRIDTDEAVSWFSLTLALEPRPDRWITRVGVTTSAGERLVVDLDETSFTPAGQRIELGEPATWWEIEILAANSPRARKYDQRGPVGIAGVHTELEAVEEVVRLPTRVPDTDTPLAVVMTRLRTDPLERWRSDPETRMVRSVVVSSEWTARPEVTVRLDRRASDAVIADLFGVTVPVAAERLVGAPQAGGWALTDGDPATAWITPFGVGAGSTVRIPRDSTVPTDRLVVTMSDDDRLDEVVEVIVDDGTGEPQRFVLDTAGAGGRHELVLERPVTAESFSLTVSAVAGSRTYDRRYGEWVEVPVGIAEVEGPGIASARLPERLDTGCRSDLVRLDDRPLALRVTGETSALLAGAEANVELCGDTELTLAAGETVLRTEPGHRTGLDVDRVVLLGTGAHEALAGRDPPDDAPRVLGVESGRTWRTVTVGPCPDGCWLVQGDGFSTSWRATLDGRPLAAPEPVSGGATGWWLEPSAGARTVELSWPAQRWIWFGLGVSALAVATCVVLMVVGPGTSRGGTADGGSPLPRFVDLRARDRRRRHGLWVWAGVSGAVLVSPLMGLVAAVVAAIAVAVRRRGLLGVAAVAGVALAGTYVVIRQILYRPLPDFAWVLVHEEAHWPALLAVVLAVALVVWDDDGAVVRDNQSTQFQVNTSRTPGTETSQRSRGQ